MTKIDKMNAIVKIYLWTFMIVVMQLSQTTAFAETTHTIRPPISNNELMESISSVNLTHALELMILDITAFSIGIELDSSRMWCYVRENNTQLYSNIIREYIDSNDKKIDTDQVNQFVQDYKLFFDVCNMEDGTSHLAARKSDFTEAKARITAFLQELKKSKLNNLVGKEN